MTLFSPAPCPWRVPSTATVGILNWEFIRQNEAGKAVYE